MIQLMTSKKTNLRRTKRTGKRETLDLNESLESGESEGFVDELKGL